MKYLLMTLLMLSVTSNADTAYFKCNKDGMDAVDKETGFDPGFAWLKVYKKKDLMYFEGTWKGGVERIQIKSYGDTFIKGESFNGLSLSKYSLNRETLSFLETTISRNYPTYSQGYTCSLLEGEKAFFKVNKERGKKYSQYIKNARERKKNSKDKSSAQKI